MSGYKRPSKQLEDLLMERVAWEDAQPGIRSWARKPIYDAACEILALPTKGERRNALGCIPPAMRARVQAEIMRVWEMRGKP